MLTGNNHRDIVSEHEGDLVTKETHNAESDRPKNKNSHKKKPFTCRVAIFDEKEDPNKKCMYPKHLVYQDGKDLQLEEIRAMHYWKKVRGPELNNFVQYLDRPKTKDAFTQTEFAGQTEASSQTEDILEKHEDASEKHEDALEKHEDVSEKHENASEKHEDVLEKHESVAAIKSKPATKGKKNQNLKIENVLPRIATRSRTNKPPSTIPEESGIPSSNFGHSKSDATFLVSKGKPKEEKANLHQRNCNGEHSDENDEADDTINTKVFKVVAASTPFQEDKIKNKNSKDRRKAMKLEIPLPMW